MSEFTEKFLTAMCRNGLEKFADEKLAGRFEALTDRMLEVNAHNLAAVKLYEACGFETFSKRTAYYHDGADALMMEWKRKNE